VQLPVLVALAAADGAREPPAAMRQDERRGDGRFHDGLLMDLLRGELRCAP
jgi:hypothetical protein